jgi:hypothetical protein
VVRVGLVGSLASDKLAPSLVGLVDDLDGVLLGLCLTGESKDVLWLSIRDLVDAEPLVGGTDQTGQVPLDILNVVETGSKRVVAVNDNDHTDGLTLIEEGHDTEDLDLLDLTNGADELSDLANIQRVVVTVRASLGVSLGRVLPSLGEGTVVPDVTVVGEDVLELLAGRIESSSTTYADETELALLDV